MKKKNRKYKEPIAEPAKFGMIGTGPAEAGKFVWIMREGRMVKRDGKRASIWITRHTAGEVFGFILLVGMYIAASFITPRVSKSADMLIIGKARLPVSAFAGVVSSLGNICIISLVVFYRKQGFVTALALILLQASMWICSSIAQRSLASIPGFFSLFLTVLAIALIRSRDKTIDKYRSDELQQMTEQKKLTERLFEETATALVTAIDAKDEYSHGHSLRVAEYAQRIARLLGKDEEECRRVYYAGLLHDVGKLGIPESIISKKTELTPEEYEIVKQHPVLGDQILSSIRDYPYIRCGARSHHEWYDGTGYPDGLKGEQIPEIARIISVADAYDTLSSNRCYRSAIPQQLIREEIVKGAGTQFDPAVAMAMRHLIDLDGEYRMQEMDEVRRTAAESGVRCGAYRSEVSDGILITREITKIRLCYRDGKPAEERTYPTAVLFDSLDGKVHAGKAAEELNYFEYCEVSLDGKAVNRNVREIRSAVTEDGEPGRPVKGQAVFELETVKCGDHALLRIIDGGRTTEVTVALPDSSRFVYLGLTGSDCFISDIEADKALLPVAEDYIPRIAEAISYIDGPEGDLPNLQVDGIRSASTPGVPVKDRMKITFHTMSLPTARLIWHCPYVVLFHSGDGRVNGAGYREYAVIRLDGENWESEENAQSTITATRSAEFVGWEEWKRLHKEGLDCTVSFARTGSMVMVSTSNLGLSVKDVTVLPEVQGEGKETLYAALTGDQCAITNIRVVQG